MSLDSQDSGGHLATGPRRLWSRSRPRLAASDGGSAAAAPTPGSSHDAGQAIRFIASVVLVLLAVAFGFWLVLGLTVLPTVRVDGALWVVQRAASPEGKYPSGATVLALPNPVQRGFADRLAEIFSTSAGDAIVTLVAGPNTRVSTARDGQILVDGVPTKFRTPPNVPTGQTGNNYLALCRSGACGIPGDPLLVPIDRVLGKVLGSVSPGAFGPFPAYRGVPE